MEKIREFEISDAKYIAKISSESLGYPCDKSLVEKRLRNIDKRKQRVFVAIQDDIVVGFIQAEVYQLLYQEDSINILGLAVSKDYQGKGYGTRLVKRVEEWAKEMNCNMVRVNSEVSRIKAHEFYDKLGYVNTKSQKRFVKNID